MGEGWKGWVENMIESVQLLMIRKWMKDVTDEEIKQMAKFIMLDKGMGEVM